MRKIDVIRKISDEDKKLLGLCDNKKYMLHPEKLTMKDLKRLLDAFKTMYELFYKCAEEKKND